MNKKIITILVWTLMIVPVFTVTATKNISVNTERVNIQSPNIPMITGETNGILGEKYEYAIAAIDPQGDDVFYKIRWGDCAIMNWAGPYRSGEKVTFGHAFCDRCCSPGIFTVSVQAEDVNEEKSNWGTLDVTMASNGQHSLIISLILRFLGQHPNVFPILRHMLGL